MAVIHLLDYKTIDKIAAGEVVEKPASVVKELVENSIDAGATALAIEIKNGGIDYIRITDNGIGIDNADVKNAFLRHATSKIETADDLQFVQTLGFRGEALPSISSVAKGCFVAGFTFIPAISFLHSSINLLEITSEVVPSSMAFLIILSSTSVKFDTKFTSYPLYSKYLLTVSNTIIGLAFPM